MGGCMGLICRRMFKFTGVPQCLESWGGEVGRHLSDQPGQPAQLRCRLFATFTTNTRAQSKLLVWLFTQPCLTTSQHIQRLLQLCSHGLPDLSQLRALSPIPTPRAKMPPMAKGKPCCQNCCRGYGSFPPSVNCIAD